MQPRKAIAAVLATAAATLVGVLAAPASAYTPEWGSTGSPDRVLRHGCHEYRYHYKVTVPTHDWTLETFLVDPTGDRLASGAFASESDPDRGHGTWHICKPSTRPGTFHIKAKINWYNGDTDHKGWFKPSHFRLTAP
ncbi:MAG: hypothetical protein ACXVWZ_13370 [Nocardioides sp.]